MPRLKPGVLRKPLYIDIAVAVHALGVKLTMPILCINENFSGFRFQDCMCASLVRYVIAFAVGCKNRKNPVKIGNRGG